MVFSSQRLTASSGGHDQAITLHGNLPQFHVPVAGKLVPADLHRTADHVGLVGGFAGGLHLFAPAPLHGHAAQHGGLAGAGGGAAQGVGGIRRVPQVGQHVHAAVFDLGRLRVFVLVDHVLVDAFVHQLVDFRIQPGLAEGRQVLAGVAVQHQLVVHHLVGVAWVVLFFRHLVLGHHDRQVRRCIHIIQ